MPTPTRCDICDKITGLPVCGACKCYATRGICSICTTREYSVCPSESMTDVAKIIIAVEGGIIQDMSGIPKGVEIEVRDYDIEGENENDLDTNADGNQHTTSIWAHGDCQ